MKKFLLFAFLLFVLWNTEALGQDIKYIDHSVSGTGTNTKVTAMERSVASGSYIVGDELANLVGTDGNVYIQDKTVVFTKDHIYNNPIVIWGTVNFTLCDNVTVTCSVMINVASGHTLNIYGQEGNTGKLIAIGDLYSAGIGSIENVCAGKINIHGGDIDATGGYRGAGIGGSSYKGFDVAAINGGLTIYGGKVRACGGCDAAGIGSGYQLSSSDAISGYVTIYGGEITAIGDRYGAGIGGGYEGPGAILNIYGGEVTAFCKNLNSDPVEGGGLAAGIGGGWEGNSGPISIYGGTIKATGGLNCAGIGSGRGGTAADIRIYGGNITAIGGESGGAGIGSGLMGICRNITISGGTINATASKDAAGIGCGAVEEDTEDTFTIDISGDTITATGNNGAAIGAGGIFNADECSYSGKVIIGGDNTTLILTASGTRKAVDIYTGGSVTVSGKLAVSTGGNVCTAENRISTLTSVQEARVEPCTHGGSTYTINDANTHGYATCQYCATSGTSENHSFNSDGKCVCGLIRLMDNADNSNVLDLYKNTPQTIFLSGRTLYKDKSWNTLCLPFAVSDFSDTPLVEATVKTLSSASFNSNTGTLTLNFSDDLTAIDAGKPYIVK